ncbi:MAG: hypothetical protein WCO56_22970, partial [Verrucomicrobiota bacterium]
MSNNYDGVTIVAGGILTLKNSAALGTTNGSTYVYRTGGTNAAFTDATGQLRLDPGTGNSIIIQDALYLDGDAQYGYQGALLNNTGTNYLNGPVTMGTNGLRMQVADGRLIVNGSITNIGTGSRQFVANPNGSKVLTLNGTIDLTSSGPMLVHGGGLCELNASSNVIGGLSVQYNTTLKLGTNNVFPTPPSLTLGDNTAVPHGIGTINLNGYNLTLRSITTPGTNAIACSITSAVPAMLTITNNSANSYTGRVAGAVSLTKLGAGTLTMVSVSNSFTGNALIKAGSLSLVGDSGFSNAVTIQIDAGASLVVTGRNDGTLNLGFGQTLSGNGTVAGNVVNYGTLAPGSNGIGVLTVTNNVGVNGTTIMEISKVGSVRTNDLLTGAIWLTNGGTLTVVLAAGSDPVTSLVAGDSWKLFNAANYTGTFAVTNLPAGVVWDTSTLNTDGTIRVIGVGTGGLTVTPSPTNTVEVNSPAGFLASASGTEPITYFWYANSNYLTPVAITNAFTNASVVCSDNNTHFNVVASNAYGGSLTSAPVYVAVIDTRKPVFVTDLVQATNTTGVGSNFMIAVSMAMSCQTLSSTWYYDTTNVFTKGDIAVLYNTNASLTLTNLQTTNSGTYMVSVANVNGATNSMVVTLVVTNHSSTSVGLVITPSPTNTVAVGTPAEFTATVTGGSAPIGFYWYKLPNLTVPVGTGNSYTSAVVTCANEGDAYQVVASNSVGTVTSTVAYVEVRD